MRRTTYARSCRFALTVLVVAAWGESLNANDEAAQLLRQFTQKYCVDCHGGEDAESDFQLDTLKLSLTGRENFVAWQNVLDRLESAEMPPEDAEQPGKEDRDAAVVALKSALKAASVSISREQVVLRRLNRRQYRNTIRDLLKVDVELRDPTAAFPADDVLDGFDNIGSGLMMSDFLLKEYLTAARLALDAVAEDGPRPEAETFRMADRKTGGKAMRGRFVSKFDPVVDDVLFLYINDERAPGDARGQTFDFSPRVPHDGTYEFSFEVESKGRGNFADKFGVGDPPDYQVYSPDELHRLEIYIVAPQAGTSPVRRLVEAIDLPDDKRMSFVRRFNLLQGCQVQLAFGNGPIATNTVPYALRLGHNFSNHPEGHADGKNRGQVHRKTHELLKRIDAPRIMVYDATERGPFYEQWPPPSRDAVYGKPDQSDEAVIRSFAARAFRRPVTDDDVAPFLKVATAKPEGVRTAIEAILCSPQFLYLYENDGPLDDYALASRLSYFLWNTMPDATLMKLASQRKLREPRILLQQTERMLSDPKSGEFVSTFVGQWLKLQNMRDMAPDAMKFNDFYRRRLGDAMVKESEMFFRHLLDENLPVDDFINADFTFLNAALARHYGIPGVVKTKLHRVRLVPNAHRGGLLGQGAVLTASANGVDTSPVKRGVWVLENLLGTPPAPPPDNVDVPEPDARGDLTIRQFYAKHRTIQTCNQCHKKIDPLGFALENFDPVGRWREKYASGRVIDASGRMPNGNEFTDVTEMKEILRKDTRLFKRNLTAKLLTYATGRIMEAPDRPSIDKIVIDIEAKGLGLRDLVKAVVTSEIFLTK